MLKMNKLQIRYKRNVNINKSEIMYKITKKLTSSGKWSLEFSKNIRQQLIKNDAGEARDPSRKMRFEKSCKQRPESIRNDLYGASYGRFTETHFCNIYIYI